jgi:osmoprotectant transport system permease protein
VSLDAVSAGQVVDLTLEHLGLVGLSTGLAALAGIPLGVVAAHRRGAGRVILALAGGLQVVPSLALFGLLLPVPYLGGIGARSAVVALVLYALLPIVRSTAAGLEAIERPVLEAAVAMGMTPRQVLTQVELPLAAGVIAAGVRTALVIGVGVATVAAAIGAGGLGTLIFRGLRMNDNGLVLAGALPAALLAVVLDVGLGLGLRLSTRGWAAAGPGRRGLGLALLAAVLVGPLLLTGWRERAASPGEARPRVTICTKDFTEQVILGELLAQGLEARGVEVVRRFELGGNLCHQALLAGSVDVYPEYTGTAYTALLGHPTLTDAELVQARVREEYARRFEVEVSAPLGFANDFVILMRADDQAARGVHTLSELARVAPSLRAGFGQDFMSRPDGYPGLAAAYGLRFAAPPRELELSLTYRALAEGQLDVIAGDSTNGLIDALGLSVVADDRHVFPPYEAVWLTRRGALAAVPALREAIDELASALPTATMRALNREAETGPQSPAEVARRFRATLRR